MESEINHNITNHNMTKDEKKAKNNSTDYKKIKYDPKVYLQWEKKYKLDPVRTRTELRKMDKYYKQYLYILTLTRNVHLINDIYDIMVDKFRYDIYQYQKGKRISTIAKWLPREKSSFDKQLDFINKFTDKMYPGMPKAKAFKTYRLQVAELSKKLKVAETLISSNDIDNVNFRNVPVVCLRKNMHIFMSKPEVKQKLLSYLNKKFVDISEKNYIDYLTNNNLHPVEKQICISAFSIRKNNLLKKHPFLNNISDRKMVPVLDLSSDTFKSGKVYKNILIALMTMNYTDNIIINSKNPTIIDIHHKKNISDKVKEIMKHINESHEVNLDKIKELTKNDLFIISDKKVTGEYSNKKRIVYWPKRTTESINIYKQLVNHINILVMIGIIGIIILAYIFFNFM